MKFTTLSLALVAASTASASKHFHPRRWNVTASAGGELTTLTLFTTTVHTITSCAATITDCPAGHPESTKEAVVTETIALTTTVCPVSEAESASSAMASEAATATQTAAGVTAKPTVPIGTGVTASERPGVTGSAAPSESVVLTYTLGTGSSTTVVTTTIKQTSTQTVYATLPAGEEPTARPGSGGPEDVTRVDGVADSSTTTLTSTSTTTKYITIQSASSAAAGGPAGSGAAGDCAAPATVTVTETETVTHSAPVITSTNAGAVVLPTNKNQAVSISSEGPVVIYSTIEVVPIYSDSPESEKPTAAPKPTAVDSATIVPPPISTIASYPYTNGTTTRAGPSGVPGSSGFISLVKPTQKPSDKPTNPGYPTY